VGELVALADAAHVGAAGLSVGFAIRFLTSQDARVRGDSHDEVPMEPTMHGRLAIAMTPEVFRIHGTHAEDDGDNEPKLEIVHNMCRQIGTIVVSRATLLRHT
jgi:hypothetical protein